MVAEHLSLSLSLPRSLSLSLTHSLSLSLTHSLLLVLAFPPRIRLPAWLGVTLRSSWGPPPWCEKHPSRPCTRPRGRAWGVSLDCTRSVKGLVCGLCACGGGGGAGGVGGASTCNACPSPPPPPWRAKGSGSFREGSTLPSHVTSAARDHGVQRSVCGSATRAPSGRVHLVLLWARLYSVSPWPHCPSLTHTHTHRTLGSPTWYFPPT